MLLGRLTVAYLCLVYVVPKFAKEIKEEGACDFSFVIGLSVCMILLCYMNP